MDEIAHVEELAWELVDFDRNKVLPAEEWFPYLKQVFYQQFQPFFHLSLQEIQKQYLERISNIVQKLKGTSMRVNTTMYLDEVIVQKLSDPEKFLKLPTSAYLPRKYIHSFLQSKEKHQQLFKGGEDLAPVKYAIDKALLIQLHRAGIPLTLGTDAGTGAMGIVPGFAVHEELRVLTENGFSPYEAIRTATVNASSAVAAMTGIDDFGTIEIGKRADFILLENNPLDDVANIENRLGVMAAGRWFDKNEIQNMTSHTVPAGILKPGEKYRWQVRVSDNGNWLEEQNRVHTRKLSFKTAETLN